MNKLTRLLTTTLMVLGVALPCNTNGQIKTSLFENENVTQFSNAPLTNGVHCSISGYDSDKGENITDAYNNVDIESVPEAVFDSFYTYNEETQKYAFTGYVIYMNGDYAGSPHYDLTYTYTSTTSLWYKWRKKMSFCYKVISNNTENASFQSSNFTFSLFPNADIASMYNIDTSYVDGIAIYTYNETTCEIGSITSYIYMTDKTSDDKKWTIQANIYNLLTYLPSGYSLYFSIITYQNKIKTPLFTPSSNSTYGATFYATTQDISSTSTISDYAENLENENETQSSQIQSYESQIEQLWDLAKTQREMLETAITNYNALNLTTFSYTWSTTTDSDLESYVKENTLVGKKLTGIQNNQLQDLQTQIEKLKSELEQAETNYKNATSSLLDINTKAGANYESWREKALEAGINIDDITNMEKGISSSFGTGTTLYYINAMSGLMQLYNNKVVNGDSGAYGDYSSTIQYLNAQVDELTTKYNNLLNDYNEQGDKVDELTAKIKENETTIAQLQAQIKTMQQDYSDYTWDSYFWALASTPFTFISSFLNFNVMGVNVFALVSTLLTMGLIIYLIRKLI